MNKKNNRIFGKALMVCTIIFFYLPIVFMMVFSFNDSKSLTHFTGFSLRWYEAMIKSHDMMESLYVTIAIAVLATVISTVIGTITAIGLSNSKKIVRKLVTQINDFPLMNPDIVTAIGLMLLFITLKVDKGFMTMLLAHIAFCIPYVILSINPKLRSLDPNLADAAMDLGATPSQALTKVIIPEIMPGVVSGALIAFTMSFDDFIISYFATGGGVKNLSIMVYTMSKRVNPSINAISTLVVVLITTVLLLMNIVPALRKNKDPQPGQYKKYGIIGAVVIALVAGLFFFRNNLQEKPYAGQTLNIYLPGEYIDDEVVAKFEEQTGAKVVMDNFDSNEQMYIKVANGEKYDILIPSDYMIERLEQEGYLKKLDQSKVTCLSYITEDALDLSYDPGNELSVPYFWGTVGIVYDTEVVDYEDLEKDGWNIFLNEKYKGDVYLYDSERDMFMVALKALGYSMNTTNEDELREAYQWLVDCVQTMETEIVTDEIIDNMAQARKALGLVYSGDATYIIDENDQLDYYLPEQGTNIWCDAMVIPKVVEDEDLAYEFMNFITEYENAYANSVYVGYTSPNEDVINELSSEGGDFEGISAYVPRSGFEKDEVFKYNASVKKMMADLWARVKIAASNA